MRLTERHLTLLSESVTLNMEELQRRIGYCPDHDKYADFINKTTAEIKELRALRDIVDKSLFKEKKANTNTPTIEEST